jgi:spermidine synthase
VLGIDAFSGDSIPMHLVTREAMQLYLKHLAPDGVIVFQATNRYIDIMPVMKRHANELGLDAVLVSDIPASRSAPITGCRAPTRSWSPATSHCWRIRASPRRRREIRDRPELPTFTDAHHNLVRILK